MPYINADKRQSFKNSIEEALRVMTGGHEPAYVKGEYFGYLANRIIKRFAQSSEADIPSFNSNNFNPAKKADLTRIADKFSSLIFGGDPLEGAGDLNYVISTLLWGLLGAANDTLIGETPKANYGTRAYLEGMLEQIRDELNSTKFGSSETKERIMLYRRLLITKRVVRHILDENYRINDVPYEELKIKENGTLYQEDGELNLGNVTKLLEG